MKRKKKSEQDEEEWLMKAHELMSRNNTKIPLSLYLSYLIWYKGLAR